MSEKKTQEGEHATSLCCGQTVTLTRFKKEAGERHGRLKHPYRYTCYAQDGTAIHDPSGKENAKCPLFGSADCLIQSF